MSLSASKPVTNLLFSLLTLGASRELATPRAGEQSSGAESLEDDRHGDAFVAGECSVRRPKGWLGEHPFVGITPPTIDHLDPGPATHKVRVLLDIDRGRAVKATAASTWPTRARRRAGSVRATSRSPPTSAPRSSGRHRRPRR